MGVWDQITDGDWAEDALPVFASTITPAESDAGFVAVHVDAAPYDAVIRYVDDRILVTKMQDPITRQVIYAIVDRRSWTPIAGYTTLRALLDRFPLVH